MDIVIIISTNCNTYYIIKLVCHSLADNPRRDKAKQLPTIPGEANALLLQTWASSTLRPICVHNNDNQQRGALHLSARKTR
jgi:hypothetical protein